MDKTQKQQIINEVTSHFRNKQWFNGAGFQDENLIIAYNFYPALDLKYIQESMHKFGISFALKDIKVVLPGSQKDDVPPYIR
jgi:hypothetical protein